MLAGTTAAVLFAAIATAGEVKLADGAPTYFDESPATAPVPTSPPVTIPPLGTSDVGRIELPGFVVVMLQVLFFGCVAIFAVLVLIHAWNHRPSLHWRRGRRRRAAEFDVLEDVATVITADAEAQRDALRRGSPRNAIVECWLRLEAAVVAAGVRRDPADTSAELTQRVLANRHVDPAAIASLAALYPRRGSRTMRWARTHAAPPSERSMRSTRASDPTFPRSGQRVSDWTRSLVAIVAIVIAVDVLMVIGGMGPNLLLVAAVGIVVGVVVLFIAELLKAARICWVPVRSRGSSGDHAVIGASCGCAAV